jgi:hypothetical protein
MVHGADACFIVKDNNGQKANIERYFVGGSSSVIRGALNIRAPWKKWNRARLDCAVY